MDDQSIVECFLQRDEAAIKHCMEKYGGRLRSLAYGIVQDWQSAEECENDTYLEAWQRIPPHEPGNYLYAFLARMTRHLALNCCRYRSRLKRSAYIVELSTELEQCIPAPDELECRLEDRVLGQVLNDFLSQLDEEKRAMFIRRYWFLDSIAVIARRYAVSESKVKTTLFRCRKKLKEQLEKEGYSL